MDVVPLGISVVQTDKNAVLYERRNAHDLHARFLERSKLALLTGGDIDAMRAANARFARALHAADVDAAISADDDFHAVAVEASANPLLPGLLEQVTPLLRRLERARFESLAGRGSVADHDRIIELCAAGDAAGAAAAARENWLTLERLLPEASGPSDA